MTMIARVADGLPLAASMTEDEQTSRNLTDYQSQAKQLFRRLSNTSPSRCTLETGTFLFHYLLDRGICYLILTERQFSKKLAFAFLDDIQVEFQNQFGSRVETVSRPYSFIEFDTYIQKSKKNYTDSRASANLNNLNVELQDVQRIMVQNIDDVLQRGESLSALDDKAHNLASLSQKYRKDAAYLNMRSAYWKYALFCVLLLILFSYIYFTYLY